VASKLFGHVTFYVADEESGSRCHNACCAHGSAPTGRSRGRSTRYDESGFEPVGAQERSYGNAA